MGLFKQRQSHEEFTRPSKEFLDHKAAKEAAEARRQAEERAAVARKAEEKRRREEKLRQQAIDRLAAEIADRLGA
jgi:hypothetical protein